ncbi:uncharacterized protein B0H18DRAFT_1032556 [Fomitopsis serialis]|uniref:uncharacterized protein n=1 Tax=Fomitopsis serialis TaxID=139415 RepID=UPI0020073AB1|nr:uncharacterized protein B0H18DRAFT_1032556 [Neoantrodia serialis]KAH9918089.1 hypothetical protein B0H18DRAFT_1032556 [Neoantrodia serialis]
MLLQFPVDVFLYILSFVPVNDLYSLQLVSRQVNHLIGDNEESVYHQAAVLHRFAPPEVPLEKVKRFEARNSAWLDDARSWKELCRRWTVVERNWDGHGALLEGGYTSEDGVLHFKVDEEERTVLAVSRTGGMSVHAMEDNRLLWRFSKDYLVRTRCELSNGFLVFPSKHRGIEIWRRSSDVFSPPSSMSSNRHAATTPIADPSPSAALTFQLTEAAHASTDFPPTSCDGLRGQYTPHAYIGQPYVDTVRIFRVRFPVLAVMSIRDRNAVLLFDLVDGTLLRRIGFGMERVLGAPAGFRPPPVSDRVVMDIDVSDAWITVCLHSAVIIVPRSGAVSNDEQTPPTLVLAEDDPPQLLQDTAMQLEKVVDVQEYTGSLYMPQASSGSLACVPGVDAMQKFKVVPPSESVQLANNQALVPVGGRHVPQCFVAARFSPDGRHFAAVTVFGLLYVVPDFARVARGTASFEEIARRVYMGEWLRDLEWEGQSRRLAVQTASEEIYLINLDSSHHYLHPTPPGRMESLDPFANMTVYHLTDFSNPDLGWARARGVAFSGVQLTRTMLWMIWDLALLRRAVSQQRRTGQRNGSRDRERGGGVLMPSENGSVCFINFTPGLESGGRIIETAERPR